MFEQINGNSGWVTVAGGAKAAIFGQWNITRSGLKPDGKPVLRLRARFSWANDTLMSLKMKKRVVLQVKTKLGVEDIDVLDWQEWRIEGDMLVLEDIAHFDAKKPRLAD